MLRKKIEEALKKYDENKGFNLFGDPASIANLREFYKTTSDAKEKHVPNDLSHEQLYDLCMILNIYEKKPDQTDSKAKQSSFSSASVFQYLRNEVGAFNLELSIDSHHNFMKMKDELPLGSKSSFYFCKSQEVMSTDNTFAKNYSLLKSQKLLTPENLSKLLIIDNKMLFNHLKSLDSIKGLTDDNINKLLKYSNERDSKNENSEAIKVLDESKLLNTQSLRCIPAYKSVILFLFSYKLLSKENIDLLLVHVDSENKYSPRSRLYVSLLGIINDKTVQQRIFEIISKLDYDHSSNLYGFHRVSPSLEYTLEFTDLIAKQQNINPELTRRITAIIQTLVGFKFFYNNTIQSVFKIQDEKQLGIVQEILRYFTSHNEFILLHSHVDLILQNPINFEFLTESLERFRQAKMWGYINDFKSDIVKTLIANPLLSKIIYIVNRLVDIDFLLDYHTDPIFCAEICSYENKRGLLDNKWEQIVENAKNRRLMGVMLMGLHPQAGAKSKLQFFRDTTMLGDAKVLTHVSDFLFDRKERKVTPTESLSDEVDTKHVNTVPIQTISITADPAYDKHVEMLKDLLTLNMQKLPTDTPVYNMLNDLRTKITPGVPKDHIDEFLREIKETIENLRKQTDRVMLPHCLKTASELEERSQKMYLTKLDQVAEKKARREKIADTRYQKLQFQFNPLRKEKDAATDNTSPNIDSTKKQTPRNR